MLNGMENPKRQVFIRGVNNVCGIYKRLRDIALLFCCLRLKCACPASFCSMPDELFRKILHMILLGSIFGWMYAFKTWWVSAIAAIVFILMVFPILAFAERVPGYSQLLIERKKGEIKRSLIVVFVMFAILIVFAGDGSGKDI